MKQCTESYDVQAIIMEGCIDLELGNVQLSDLGMVTLLCPNAKLICSRDSVVCCSKSTYRTIADPSRCQNFINIKLNPG